jgi:hypothetical protein
MGAAIGFAVVVIVLGVLLPEVLGLLEELLLVALQAAVEFLRNFIP